jgi:hypothetical protein
MAFRGSTGELAELGAFTFRLTMGLIERHNGASMANTTPGPNLVPDGFFSLLYYSKLGANKFAEP